MDNKDLIQKVNNAVKIIHKQAVISPIITGLSGGKDSLVLCQLFKIAGVKCKYFHLVFMPNLRIDRDLMAYPIARFNIPPEDVYNYVGDGFYLAFRSGLYGFPVKELRDSVKKVRRKDMYTFIARQHKATVCTGVKRVDSIETMRMIDNNRGIGIHPLKDWKPADIFSFLKSYRIDLPPLTKKGVRGVGLRDQSINFLYEEYPDDIEKIEKVFPFVKVAVWKYKYYDLRKDFRIV